MGDDIQGMIRKGQIKLSEGAKIVIGGKTRRSDDGRKLTQPPQEKLTAKRRAAAKRAKQARKANRG